MNSKQLVVGKFKVAQNGKSRGGGGELLSDKSRYWHLLPILTIFDGKV